MTSVVTSVLTQLGLPVSQSLQITPCHGGDINEAWHCRTPSDDWFVKLNRTTDDQFFQLEANALTELTEQGKLSCPEVVGVTQSGAYQALVLSWIDLGPLSDQGYYLAGQQLARCHQVTHSEFGWPEDNLIGSTGQKNSWHSDWGTFFIENRLRVQIEGLGDRVLQRQLPELENFRNTVGDYQPQASLLHGDLWAGNLAGDANGNPVFFDPASYYGDRETDLALTELFGGFPSAFYEGYQSVWPLHPDYRRRRPWYQLYHILNHATIFGGHYLADARQRLARLIDDH